MTRDTAERAKELTDLAKWILVNRHCMIGSNPDAPIEKWCYCGWCSVGLLAHSQHEADERVKEIVERLTKVQAEARERLAAWMIEHSFSTGHGDTFEDLLKELDWQVKELRGARLDGIRDAEAAFKEAYSEYEEPLIGVMYGMKAIAALAQALQPATGDK